MLPSLLFYVFSGVLTISALLVIAARNPVHSVLFLILCFFNAAGLFVLLGAEFLAMTLVIVYVGAVAVLFLFVVMMLDIDFRELKRGFVHHAPIGVAVALILFSELVFYGTGTQLASTPISASLPADNTRAIGAVLYTQYMLPFQIAGLILLVAMIGAIVLTLRHKPDAKRQNLRQQLDRKREETVRLVSLPSGGGVAT